jgi:hypothetical protein
VPLYSMVPRRLDYALRKRRGSVQVILG